MEESYSDAPDGLPGNDDSGAMSSWLAFHMLGFYPNAGQSYYLLLAPMVPDYKLSLCNGRQLHVVKKGKGSLVKRILLNGSEITDARLEHEQLMEGGELVFLMRKEKPQKVRLIAPQPIRCSETKPLKPFASYDCHFTLNRQFRTWPVRMAWEGDTLMLTCKETLYKMPRHVVERSDRLCWLIPADGQQYVVNNGTFGFISRKTLHELKENGTFVLDFITWRLMDETDQAYHVRADIDLTEMWIAKQEPLPMILEMRNNPLGIDWRMVSN